MDLFSLVTAFIHNILPKPLDIGCILSSSDHIIQITNPPAALFACKHGFPSFLCLTPAFAPSQTLVYRNVEQYREAQRVPGLLLVRVDAPLYFANMQFVRDKLDDYEARARVRVIALFFPLAHVRSPPASRPSRP